MSVINNGARSRYDVILIAEELDDIANLSNGNWREVPDAVRKAIESEDSLSSLRDCILFFQTYRRALFLTLGYLLFRCDRITSTTTQQGNRTSSSLNQPPGLRDQSYSMVSFSPKALYCLLGELLNRIVSRSHRRDRGMGKFYRQDFPEVGESSF